MKRFGPLMCKEPFQPEVVWKAKKLRSLDKNVNEKYCAVCGLIPKDNIERKV